MENTYHSIETVPWDEINRRHQEQLVDQLHYLQKNSEYYQSKFAEWNVDAESISTLEEFREIPFTTKDDQRQNQTDPSPDQPLGSHQAVPTEDLNRTISSSGTTGKPTYFGLTEADREHWNEVLQRCFYCAGVDPDDTVIFGVGQTMVPGGTPYFEGLTQLGANVVPAGGGSTERLVSGVKNLDGDLLFTTTSHLRYLTQEVPGITGVGVDELPVSKLIGGGGPGIANPEIRQELYNSWDADLVREVMGLGDIIGCMWAECGEEDGMHFLAQGHAHVELIDPDTGEHIPFEDGAKGELVYTPLGREATPLLRYRSGDYARVTGIECACGRTSPKIQCIGRSDDMLIYKGMNVFPSAIRDVVSDVEGTLPHIKVLIPGEEKVHFEEPIPVEVVVDPDPDRAGDEVIADIVETVRSQLQVRVEPHLITLEEIELAEYKNDLVVVRE